MDVVELLGRLMLAATFVITPYGVIKSAGRVAGAPPVRVIPEALRVPAIRGSSVCSVIGALMIGLGLWPDLGALLVLGFLIPVTLVMHQWWKVEEWLPRKQMRDAFLSNVSMAGGALLLFAFVNQSQDVALAVLSDPLFGRA